MPLYDFKCNKCDHIFEELVSTSETNDPLCPECKSETEKLIGLSSFRLKGEGWYATDYKD
jgi:putative FmdB family regulatory protein